MQNIRIGNYVGVRYNVQSARDDFEIYNVAKDPGERNNLADNPERPPIIRELQQKMKDSVLAVRRPHETTPHPHPFADAFIPAVKKQDLQLTQGIRWKAYGGSFPWVPKVATLQPTAAGYSNRPDISVRVRDNQALYFTGYIRVLGPIRFI